MVRYAEKLGRRYLRLPHATADVEISSSPLPLTAATYGLVVLGVLKFLPWIGIWVWSIATFIGVGAALSTKFGRREAWFQAA